MSCDAIQPLLLGWQFETLDPRDRDAVEAHLPGCAACVRDWIALRRALAGDAIAAPSEATRARIRGDVAVRLAARARARRRLAWVAPVAAAAILVAIAVVALLHPPRLASHATPPAGQVDTAIPPGAPPNVF